MPKNSTKVTVRETQLNNNALVDCLLRANYSLSVKTVLVPKGYVFSLLPIRVIGIYNVTLQIDGVIEATPFNDSWPLKPNGGMLLDLLTFKDSSYLTFKGEGIVDGLGYDWWTREWNQENKYGRAHLLAFKRVSNSEITGIKFMNAPMYHLHLLDIDNIYIHDFEIEVSMLR